MESFSRRRGTRREICLGGFWRRFFAGKGRTIEGSAEEVDLNFTSIFFFVKIVI